MNYLQVLYQQADHDDLFGFLKQAFGSAGGNVNVNILVENSLVQFEWEGLLDPSELAQQLTEAVPSIVIESPSTTGIDTHSRYFNSTQLW